MITADGSAWRPGVTWGASTTPDGTDISWGRTADADSTWGVETGEPDLATASAQDASAFSDIPEFDRAWASTTTLPPAPQHGSLPAALLDRRWLWLLTVQ